VIGTVAGPARADLAPHKAIYSLTLGKADPAGRFVGVEGAVQTTVERTCDAWIADEQVRMRIDTKVGGHIEQDLSYAGWESLDGRNYRFFARTRINDRDTRYKGSALAGDGPGEARFTQPKKMTKTLPPGTRFYVGQILWILEQARAGATRVEATVFDGTDEEGPQRAIAFIVPLAGGAADGIGVAKPGLGPMTERPGWKVRIAFYPENGRAAAPEYEVEAVVLDNGVATRLEMIFPDFTAVQTLMKVEALAPPKC